MIGTSSITKQSRVESLSRQLRHVESNLHRLHATSSRYAWLRLAIAGGGLLAAAMAFFLTNAWLAGFCVAAATLVFGAVVYAHRRVEDSITRHEAWLQIKGTQIARAHLDWDRIPVSFPHRPSAEHPFEADIDLVGDRSLHRLLDTAVSYEGSLRLRAWLTEPIPDTAQIAQRQALVRELTPRSLFRDKLTLCGQVAAGGKKTWEADHLVRWLRDPAPDGSQGNWLLLLASLATLNAVLLVAYLQGALPPWWQITFVLYLGLTLMRSRSTSTTWDSALALQGALRQLYAVFGHLERNTYPGAPHLESLCAPFLDRAHRPSGYLARITRVVAALGIRGNPLVWFALNAVLPWDVFFAYRLQQTKAAIAGRAPAWMAVWFELEALGALANAAYLNPGYAFPEILPLVGTAGSTGPGLVFQADDLGHPLIPDAEQVRNDFVVAALGQVTIITGSNMAGKSVFLKTVGLNLALAYAGGAVNAQRLTTAPFRLFSSMTISDSVTDGISYFYAEVKRLKALLAALQPDHSLPLLYLIDEIFRGTNNRERLIGSRAYVRALAGKPGLGLIATHDLELAKLDDEVPQVVNYHFRDYVDGDRMVFDYTLRPGPCPTTNALRIMELEGLPVGDGYAWST